MSKIEEKEANFKRIYGGDNNYKENKLYNKQDGLYTRLGNAILKEIQNYDRYHSNRDVKNISYYKNKNINNRLLIGRYEFERGLRRLRWDMQYNYSTWKNNLEHEKLEKEIENRGIEF